MASLKLNGDTSGTVTLTVPAVAGTNTLTLPAVTDTLVGEAATQTLTNKTLSSPTITGTPVGLSGMLIRAPQILTGTSYTTPANCTAIIVEMWGGGGGGGSGAAGSNSQTNGAGGGGGGGAYLRQYIAVSPSTAYTIAVGAAGAAGAADSSGAGTAGGTGGTTSIIVNGTTYSCTGGAGGGGGSFSGSGAAVANPAPAVGGTATGVSPILAVNGSRSETPDSQNVTAGADGTTAFNGGIAFGGYASSGQNWVYSPPQTVPTYGGGGGGSEGVSTGSSLAGAAGGDGRMVISEYS